jgi:hypothetical protein
MTIPLCLRPDDAALTWIRRLSIWPLKRRCSEASCGPSVRTIYICANCKYSKSRAGRGHAEALAHWWQTNRVTTRVQSQSWLRGQAVG